MTAGHTPLPVQGDTKESQGTIDQVNFNKALEEDILQRLDAMAQWEEVDQRWLAIGRTKLEEAFMAINRSIFNPQRAKRG